MSELTELERAVVEASIAKHQCFEAWRGSIAKQGSYQDHQKQVAANTAWLEAVDALIAARAAQGRTG